MKYYYAYGNTECYTVTVVRRVYKYSISYIGIPLYITNKRTTSERKLNGKLPDVTIDGFIRTIIIGKRQSFFLHKYWTELINSDENTPRPFFFFLILMKFYLKKKKKNSSRIVPQEKIDRVNERVYVTRNQRWLVRSHAMV